MDTGLPLDNVQSYARWTQDYHWITFTPMQDGHRITIGSPSLLCNTTNALPYKLGHLRVLGVHQRWFGPTPRPPDHLQNPLEGTDRILDQTDLTGIPANNTDLRIPLYSISRTDITRSFTP